MDAIYTYVYTYIYSCFSLSHMYTLIKMLPLGNGITAINCLLPYVVIFHSKNNMY